MKHAMNLNPSPLSKIMNDAKTIYSAKEGATYGNEKENTAQRN